MSTAFTLPRRQVPALGQALANTGTITARNLRRLARVPTLIALATIQPILLVVLFNYGFGGAVHVPGVTHYIDYLLPGVFVLAIGFGASQTGVAVAEDLASGMIDRFRSLPIASASPTVATMPGWLQAFANLNPITVMVGALRALCLGGPTTRPVSEALAWIGGLLLITVPLAVTRYRHTFST